ncbi:hypothetical protein BCO9919_00163 [Burkholderia cenocepacia]|uniref:Uncharacterized protein n=1 Tax=Burkholderia cenocepacia TaxID=95486 RepID=A0A6J5ISL9_9BURK|nr:hypothetical protein BCO9919_00163 [Burkholderia cenocepacia]
MGDASGRADRLSGKRVAVRRWPRAGRGWRSCPVWQGFQRLVAVTLTIEMHRVAIGRQRGMSTTPRPSADRGSRAHRSIAQFFEWRGGRDVHICVGMRWALASTLTVEIHSAASGFRLGISTSARAYRVDRRPAFGVRMLRVVSGLVGWKGVQKHACRAIADSRSWWKYVGSRVGLSAGKARWNTHAAQSRAGAQRGNALGREWVICRKGTLEHACCAIASLHSAWKRTGSRAGLSAGRAHWYTHAGQSRARTLRGDALGRERVYRPDEHAGTRMAHNRGLALTREMHWVGSGLIGRTGTPEPACCAIADSHTPQKYTLGTSRFIGQTCTPQRACGTIAGSRSPLKYTGLRVSATVVIPARSGLADQPRGHPHR